MGGLEDGGLSWVERRGNWPGEGIEAGYGRGGEGCGGLVATGMVVAEDCQGERRDYSVACGE